MRKRVGLFLIAIGLLGGCFGQSGKAPFVRQYVLEYPPPQGAGQQAVESVIRVEMFTADRLFTGQEMIYRTGSFRRDAYTAHRWRVRPADMVTGCLRRDLRESGLFGAVLSERDAEDVRYSLAGGVEEFVEIWEAGNHKALLAVTVTLMDHFRKESVGWVVFQKTHRIEEAIDKEGAAGLAAAMSRAMAEMSRRVAADIASTLKAPGR